MRQQRAATIIATLRSLSDFDLDAVRKALQDEGARRGRVWAQPTASGFGRRKLG